MTYNDPQDDKTTSSNFHSTATPEDLLRIHSICNEFESKWSTNERVSIERMADRFETNCRSALLESLIRSELELRENESPAPAIHEFLDRFPNDRIVIESAFRPASEGSWDDVSSRAGPINGPAESGPLDAHPSILGAYKILGEIARGGMGIVYRAQHAELDRIVALKVMNSGQLASPSELARFQKEASAIAALDHPNIVPVFESGEASGFHYFSMPLIDGETLADKIRDRPMPPKESAEIASQIATAVQYAHEHGIIHRDLKPRNIMLDRQSNARVTDFGLAKVIKSDSSDDISVDLTLTGQAIGTPAYMAPEQAIGNPSKLSDVYSIGAVLYTLLTGRPPFQSASIHETLRLLHESEPVEPRRLNPQIPPDLETITLKCLSKSPLSRYASAKELGDDLKRFLDGKPIQARPASSVEHLWRWMKRQPVVAGLIAAVFLSLASGLAISLWLFSIAQRNERRAIANFDVSLSTVKKYLTDVATNPDLKATGLEPLRRELLITAQDFYKQLSHDPTGTSSSRSQIVRERLADAQYNVAFISNELGDTNEANRQYASMIDAYRELRVDFPDRADYLRWIARGLHEQAFIQDKRNEPTTAQESRREAVSLFRQLVSTSHSMLDQVRLASVLAELGIQHSSMDQPSEEKAAYEEVEKICMEIEPKASELIGKPEAKSLLDVYNRLALNIQRHGRLDAAEKWFIEAIRFAKECVAADKKNATFIQSLAISHKNLSMVYVKLANFDKSDEHFHEAEKVFKELVNDHPLILEYLDGFATATFNYATGMAMRGKWTDSETAIKDALRMQLILTERQPNFFEHQLGLSHLYSTMGQIATQLGKTEEATDYYKLAIQAQAIARKLKPDDFNLLYASAILNNSVANTYKVQARFEDALAYHLDAVQIAKILVERNSTVPDYLRIKGILNHNAATTYRRLKDGHKAIELETVSKSTFEELVRNSDSTEFKSLLANTLGGMGQIYMDMLDVNNAELCLRESKSKYEEIMHDAKVAANCRYNYGFICTDLGRIALRRGDAIAALQLDDTGIENEKAELASKAKTEVKETQQVREALCNAYRERARCLLALNRNTDGIDACRQGIIQNTGDFDIGVKAILARLLSNDVAQASQDESIQLCNDLDIEKASDYATCIDFAIALTNLAASDKIKDGPAKIAALLEKAKILDHQQFELDRPDK